MKIKMEDIAESSNNTSENEIHKRDFSNGLTENIPYEKKNHTENMKIKMEESAEENIVIIKEENEDEPTDMYEAAMVDFYADQNISIKSEKARDEVYDVTE